MVKAIVDLSEHENRILTIVKGKFGLKTKSQAMKLVIDKFEEELLEPELRPEYVEKLQKIAKQKPIHVGTPDDLRKMMGLK